MTLHLDAERAAIRAVIEAETEAYLLRDYEAWQQCWLEGPETRRVQSHVGTGVTVSRGDDIKSRMRQIFAEPSKWVPPSAFERTNFNIVVSSEMAWVSYDQLGDMSSVSGDAPRRYHELKILQKVGGSWKISCLVSTQLRADFDQTPLIELDAGGQIVWMNDAAEECLRQHPILAKRVNSLWVRDEQVRYEIYTTLKQVAEIRSRLTPGLGEEAVSRVVMLGQDDAGVAHVCWVHLRDGRLLLSFDDTDRVDAQISVAAKVYRLSRKQKELARALVAGNDLAFASRALSLNPNTAKTHLLRIYDKTGVRSQSALVRLLLTADRRDF